MTTTKIHKIIQNITTTSHTQKAISSIHTKNSCHTKHEIKIKKYFIQSVELRAIIQHYSLA